VLLVAYTIREGEIYNDVAGILLELKRGIKRTLQPLKDMI
jgi:hypothetical protein